MSQMRCSNPECRSTDIDLNESSGEAVCVRCGTVCEESTIVTAEGTEGYLADRRRDPWGGRPPPPPLFFGVGDTGGKDSPVESIHDAASRGDVEAVRRLLASGVSPDSFCPEVDPESPEAWETPILALCKVRRFTDGCASCLELLRDAGADLEATDGYGLTPLHYAARGGDTKMASLLVEAGVDVDAKTLDKETALHYAARGGDTKMASLLVEAGVDVHAKTPDEETALYLAVRHGATGCVDVLLAAGASLKLREGHGLTPALHYAARRGDTKIVSLLVESGVDVDAKTPYSDEETALHLAVRQRATGCVEVLLAAGASPHLRDFHGRTPFDVGHPRTWPLLLRAGAEIPSRVFVITRPYIVRVRNAGGFKKYAQEHITRMTAILTPTQRLPDEMVRKVVEFWLHAGYY